MNLLDAHLLSLLFLLPILAALGCAAFPAAEPRGVRGFALLASLLGLFLGVLACSRFDAGATGLQLVERLPWIPSLGIAYHLGVDGLSLPLVLLTLVLTPVAILACPASQPQVRGMLACLLLLQAAVLGALLAADLFLFYICYEMALLPAYLLVGIWGSSGRLAAALRFVVYSMASSLVMLFALVVTVLWVADGQLTFETAEVARRLALRPMLDWEPYLCGALLFAFAVKLPLFPCHTWLPDTYGAAPAAGTVLLAGVLGKLGAYGILRYACTLFPFAAWQLLPYLALLGVLGLLYGALLACVQGDLRRLLAYASLSHLGLTVLGIAAMEPLALAGSLVQMVGHGVSTAGLFLCAGYLVARRGSSRLTSFGGLAAQMPLGAAAFLLLTLSSIGLPGLQGFVGEFLILLGAYRGGLQVAVLVATLGTVLAAIYMLRAVQQIFFGPAGAPVADLEGRELAALAPLLLLSLGLGLYPQPLLRLVDASASAYVLQFRAQLGLSEDGRGRPQRPVTAAAPGLPGGRSAGQAPVDASLYERQRALPWRQPQPAIQGAQP